MIHHLHGHLIRHGATKIVVECNGVGYDLIVPLSTSSNVKDVNVGEAGVAGSTVFLYTHLAIREDAHILYGFATEEERDMFRLLIDNVDGVGPKMAINTLSGLDLDQIKLAISTGDAKTLATINGIGPKTAERICLELKGKVKADQVITKTPGESPKMQSAEDAVAALRALGIKAADADKFVSEAIKKLGAQATTEQLVRASLKRG